MKRIICLLMSFLLLFGAALPVFAVNNVITNLYIYGVDEPVIGEKPDYSVVIDSPMFETSSKYDGSRSKNGVVWSRSEPGDSTSAYIMEPGVDVFESGYVYTCSVAVQAKADYIFDVFERLVGQINGQNADVSRIDGNDAQTCSVSLAFTPQKKIITKIEIVSLEKPTVGARPDFSAEVKTEGCVIDSISWMDLSADLEMGKNDTFKKGRTYRVSVMVSAKENYRFGANLGYVIVSTIGGEETYNREENGGMLVEGEWEPGAHVCAPVKVDAVKATCTTAGKKAYYACACGKNYEDAAGAKPITALSAWGITAKAPHTPGDAPTESKPQTCTVCGAILAPAKNHTHDLSLMPRVSETCVDEGVYEHYYCSGCGGFYRDKEAKEALTAEEITIPPHGHSGNGEWSFDEDAHWFTCIECGGTFDDSFAGHDYNPDTHICTICGYEESGEASAQTDGSDGGENDPFSKTLAWALPAVAIVGGGAAGASFFLDKRKSK